MWMTMVYIFGFIHERSEKEMLVIYRNNERAYNKVLIGLCRNINEHHFYAYELGETFTDYEFAHMEHETEWLPY